MRKVPLFPLLLGLFSTAFPRPAQAQAVGEPSLGGSQSFGIISSYAPNSSHILIGLAQDRRTFTLGVQYSHLLWSDRNIFRYDYEASFLPLFKESDPTVIGTTTTIGGQTYFTPQAPVRVTYVEQGPVGTASDGSQTAPIYAIYGRETTYATALTPLGIRMTARPWERFEPTFALDLGFVLSPRNIPIDNSTSFNFLFSFGPGIEIYANQHTSWRVEYLYRHMSNAGSGEFNPGVDQGILQLTLNHHR